MHPFCIVQHPGVQEILDALARLTECTPHECHESGVLTNPPISPLLVIPLLFLLATTLLYTVRPPSLSSTKTQ